MLQCDSIFEIKRKGHVLYYFHRDHTFAKDSPYVQCYIPKEKGRKQLYTQKKCSIYSLSGDTRNYLYIKLHFACKKLIKQNEPCPHQIIKTCIAFSDLRCTQTADHKKKKERKSLVLSLAVYLMHMYKIIQKVFTK